MDRTSPPDAHVRAAVAAADRRRRAQAAGRRLWRLAPACAALCLSVAVATRIAGLPPAVPLAFVAAIAAGLLLLVWFRRRGRPLSDARAASIDADAGLGGELRSASWFAAAAARDPWADLHLQRAADRLHGVDWAQIYPPVRAARARVVTLLLVAATLATATAFRAHDGVDAIVPDTGTTGDADRAAAREHDPLSPELQKQLEALLAAAENGMLAHDGRMLTNAEVRELVGRLSRLSDRAALKALAKAMNRASTATPAQDLKALADRARHAADTRAASREVRDALDELARKLSEAALAENTDSKSSPGVASSERAAAGDAVQNSDGPGLDESAIQSIREAQGAGGGASVMMMSSDQQPAGTGPPGLGSGGTGSTRAEASTAALERAIREETIEANKDTAGDNVAANIRRNTEQGQATVTFSRGQSGASDQSRATAPPTVPEARRTDVRRYFIRKP